MSYPVEVRSCASTFGKEVASLRMPKWLLLHQRGKQSCYGESMKKRRVNIGFRFMQRGQIVGRLTALPRRAVMRQFITSFSIAALVGIWGIISAFPVAANPTNPPSQLSASAPVAPIRLAIGALGGNAEEGKELADLVAVRLASAKPFELVERQELETALREQAMSFSGLVRATDAVRVGHLARADWFLLGSSATVNGTNTLFLRVVDARSATIRNVGVFSEATPLSMRAEEVARFVIRAAEVANNPLPASYLAVGGFQDTGINNRYTNFPTQIRAYLATAYQGSQVTVLEREATEPLLQELRMDIAGLTEVSTNHAETAQAAFWLVDGFYQSYETSGPELDLVLRVERVSGRRYLTPLREQPGEKLLRDAKAAIDVILAKNDGVTGGSNSKGEIELQMARGERLLAMQNRTLVLFSRTDNNLLGGIELVDPVKKRRNIEDAKQAFEAVLLLDPDNRQAKIDLATCLRFASIADLDQARSYYREIIAAGVQDGLTDEARAALAFSYIDEDFKKEAELGQTFAAQCTDPYYIRLCKSAVSTAMDQMHRRHLIPDEPLPDPEKYMTSCLQGITEKAKTGPFVASFNFGIFESAYPDRNVAADHINQLLPRLEAQFPELTPYLLYQAALCQTDTNSPVIKEFLDNLDSCVLHPEKTGNVTNYFSQLSCRKPYNVGLFEMAARVAEARLQAVRNGWAKAPDDPRKVEMAYIFMATDRWKQALDIFEPFGNRLVKIGNLSYGPWGSPFEPFIPARAAEECREHLGIAAPASIEFKLGKSLCGAECHFAFVPAADSVWVAARNGLWIVDAAGHATKKVALPTATNGLINCMAGANGKLWIGTGQAGLIEYDIASGTLYQYTEDDGLALNSIVCLLPMEDALWIGYGYRPFDEAEISDNPFHLPDLPESGGVGRMDLKTHHFTALTPPLRTDEQRRPIHLPMQVSLPTSRPGFTPGIAVVEALPPRRGVVITNSGTNGFRPHYVMSDAERIKHHADALRFFRQLHPAEPPRNRVMQLASGRPGEMWMAIWNTGIESYNIVSNSWDILPTPDDLNRWSSLALSDGQIIGGIGDATVTPQTANKTGLGMHVYGVAKGDWQHMAFQDELPANDVTAVALSGSDLWIGGKGFVAVADLNKDRLRDVCHFSGAVQAIQVQDGYAWIQLPRNLYRVSLQALN